MFPTPTVPKKSCYNDRPFLCRTLYLQETGYEYGKQMELARALVQCLGSYISSMESSSSATTMLVTDVQLCYLYIQIEAFKRKHRHKLRNLR